MAKRPQMETLQKKGIIEGIHLLLHAWQDLSSSLQHMYYVHVHSCSLTMTTIEHVVMVGPVIPGQQLFQALISWKCAQIIWHTTQLYIH